MGDKLIFNKVKIGYLISFIIGVCGAYIAIDNKVNATNQDLNETKKEVMIQKYRISVLETSINDIRITMKDILKGQEEIKLILKDKQDRQEK